MADKQGGCIWIVSLTRRDPIPPPFTLSFVVTSQPARCWSASGEIGVKGENGGRRLNAMSTVSHRLHGEIRGFKRFPMWVCGMWRKVNPPKTHFEANLMSLNGQNHEILYFILVYFVKWIIKKRPKSDFLKLNSQLIAWIGNKMNKLHQRSTCGRSVLSFHSLVISDTFKETTRGGDFTNMEGSNPPSNLPSTTANMSSWEVAGVSTRTEKIPKLLTWDKEVK